MDIAFRRLTDVSAADIIDLMSHPLVRRQMPLSRDNFGPRECEAFVAAKERLWSEHGYGPWAFLIDGRFAGWGGLQPENGEADLGLVLHPDYWGAGRALYDAIMARAFGEMGFESVTVLLPPTRTRVGALRRLGFRRDGALTIENQRFIRYRLTRSPAATAAGH